MRKVIAIGLLALGGAALLAAQRQNNSTPNPGQPIYEAHCAACHGLDAHGGEAPSIASTPEVQALTDAQLTQIIHDGHTGGMPGFATMLSDSDIAAVVSYLRQLQHEGHGPAVPGNVADGKALFFGSAGCSQCHMIKGEGGFIASDLTGAPLSADEIRNAIISPAAEPNDVLTTVVMKNGQKFSGIVRNEDNFSIQLLDEKGAFHLIDKANVARIERATTPLMPSDYATRLSPKQLQDLIAYVASQANASGGRGRRRFGG
jgi:cytochrome c oxidase cbb3-type subunit 3